MFLKMYYIGNTNSNWANCPSNYLGEFIKCINSWALAKLTETEFLKVVTQGTNIF